MTTSKHVALDDDSPLTRIAEAVYEDHEPRILEKNGRAVAAIVPISHLSPLRREFNPSDEDIEASLSAAGGWKGLVSDDLVEELYRARHGAPSHDAPQL